MRSPGGLETHVCTHEGGGGGRAISKQWRRRGGRWYIPQSSPGFSCRPAFVVGTGAMSSGCLCNPYWAVVLPGRHGTGWQSLSNIFYRHLCYGPWAPVQSSLGSWPAKMSRHCVARGIQLFSIGLWAMCTVCNVDAVSLAGVQQVYL